MNFDFPQVLILLLIGLLFFKENILSWLGQKLGFSATNSKPIEKMQEDMTHLRLHFNDDLTRILTEMQVNETQMRSTQLQQCTKLDLIVDGIQDISRNGIRIRK